MSMIGTATFCISVWWGGLPVVYFHNFVNSFHLGAQQHFALSLLPIFINGKFPSSPLCYLAMISQLLCRAYFCLNWAAVLQQTPSEEIFLGKIFYRGNNFVCRKIYSIAIGSFDTICILPVKPSTNTNCFISYLQQSIFKNDAKSKSVFDALKNKSISKLLSKLILTT